MVVMAESYLQYYEHRAMQQAIAASIELKSFFRYVDDTHAMFHTEDQAINFLAILYSQYPAIQYTIEKETEKSLNFLDVTITNNKTGKYEFAIFRKNAITNVQLKPSSAHDPKVLRGVFKGFVDRAFSICSDNRIDEELEFLIDVFEENGYQRRHLKSIVESQKHQRQQQQSTSPDQ